MDRYSQFQIIRRKTRKGRVVYYARFVDPETNRPLVELSTKQTSKAAAVRWADEKALELNVQEEASSPINKTVAEFAEGYFDLDGFYATAKQARGYHVAPVYLETCRSYTRNHIIPRFGQYRLMELTIELIDQGIIQLFQERTVSPSTVNRALRTFKLLLDGAVAQGVIKDNPAARVKQVRESKKARGVFTRGEITTLFRSPALWHDFRHYTINLLAFTSGMRMSEIRGLLVENVYPDHIRVVTQYEDRYGLKPPKAESIRDVAIPQATYSAIQRVIDDTQPDQLIFYTQDPRVDDQMNTPVTKSHITKHFYRAMEHILGITEDQRKSRNLVFHSYRHTLNTIMLSSGISDVKVRKITGHRTEEMTKNYTHFYADDFKEVSNLTAGLLEVVV